VDGAVGELQDDDGEGQERERKTEADQKGSDQKNSKRRHKTQCEDLTIKAKKDVARVWYCMIMTKTTTRQGIK
jgi:hypothetical protein